MKFLLPFLLILCSFQAQRIQGHNKHQSFAKITLPSLETPSVYLEIIKDQTGFAFWICKEKGRFEKIASHVPIFVYSSKKQIFLPLLMRGDQKLKLEKEDVDTLLQLEDKTLTLVCDGNTFHVDKNLLKHIKHHHKRISLPTFDIEVPTH
ncbi:MAG: hypothetical protein K940chlam8_00589 [Chlamydiae bacterium]|nr:hypothetical protein [Chlamydiota bacterium]